VINGKSVRSNLRGSPRQAPGQKAGNLRDSSSLVPFAPCFECGLAVLVGKRAAQLLKIGASGPARGATQWRRKRHRKALPENEAQQFARRRARDSSLLTKDMPAIPAPFPGTSALLAPRLGSSMVTLARFKRRVQRKASGSVRWRTYIVMREPSLPLQLSCLAFN
jgi:hypothetical protein